MSFRVNILREFFSLIFPESCLACEQTLQQGEPQICTACRASLPKTNFHKNSGPTPLLDQWVNHNIPIRWALAYYWFKKGGRVQHLLHQLKYQQKPEIGELLGKWYGTELQEVDLSTQFDCIIPVPLHASKLKSRGYNQSSYFARGLSSALNIPCVENLLLRKSTTESQTRKNRIARWKNVSDAFIVTDPNFIHKKRVLLADDVITTGATLEACALALQAHKVLEVGIVAIACA